MTTTSRPSLLRSRSVTRGVRCPCRPPRMNNVRWHNCSVRCVGLLRSRITDLPEYCEEAQSGDGDPRQLHDEIRGAVWQEERQWRATGRAARADEEAEPLRKDEKEASRAEGSWKRSRSAVRRLRRRISLGGTWTASVSTPFLTLGFGVRVAKTGLGLMALVAGSR